MVCIDFNYAVIVGNISIDIVNPRTKGLKNCVVFLIAMDSLSM